MKKGYKKEHVYPNESFIQEKLELFFVEQGYDLLAHKHADLKCRHEKTQTTWLIEAKGSTSQIGLDFRTCLGQIIQRMEDVDLVYGIAMPNIPQFVNQCRNVPKRVRELLKLHWLLVNEDGSVNIISPTELID